MLPVAEDILHVRLQTIGVTEHAFDINLGGTNYNWLLYDVGGAVRPFFSLPSSFCTCFFLFGPPPVARRWGGLFYSEPPLTSVSVFGHTARTGKCLSR